MKQIILISLMTLLVGCGSGGGGGSSEPETQTVTMAPSSGGGATGTTNIPATSPDPNAGGGNTTTTPTSVVTPTTPSTETPPIAAVDDAFSSPQRVARFLTQATFGPTPEQLSGLSGTSASGWLVQEFSKPTSAYLPLLSQTAVGGASTVFWRNAILADDQLRQRMVFALSQLIVVSDFGGEVLSDIPVAVTYYQDVLANHAFGNYRDLLEAVTYTPAMGHYLTYLGNQKGDPATGRVPDENYARELLQLFTVGLVALNADGSRQLDGSGNPIEIYNNRDITGLAKVFTGLDFADRNEGVQDEDVDDGAWMQPMQMNEAQHSMLEKQFLGSVIPAGTSGERSVPMALDIIFAHPNVAPFVSRQIIQRFVTSHPQPAYVGRVSAAFESGSYQLPDGTVVGDGRRGDLKATLAAVLFDVEARSEASRAAESFGKVREPAIRLTNWARSSGVSGAAAEYISELVDANSPTALSQAPFSAKSVFNFYRPGYIAPGTLTGAQGLTVPELQIVNAASLAGYPNFMEFFIFAEMTDPEYLAGLQEEFTEEELTFDGSVAATAFVPNYQSLDALAEQPAALIDQLDLQYTFGEMSNETKAAILEVLTRIPVEDQERVRTAIYLVMTSTDYLLQR